MKTYKVRQRQWRVLVVQNWTLWTRKKKSCIQIILPQVMLSFVSAPLGTNSWFRLCGTNKEIFKTKDRLYAMKGGEGASSYAQNSTFQRDAIEASKEFIREAIAENFDSKWTKPTSPICIADLGCSTGPNTFLAMQTMIEAINFQFQSEGLVAQMPEFQVFFNDQISNDFNTLFKNLPQSRKYFASGVPGSFRGRLFPRKTLHLVHSSSSLCWLSKVPKEIMDKGSSAWNKGRIFHKNAPKEVVDAYATQYKADLESFLHARAQELANNGLMLLQIPIASDVILDSDVDPGKIFEVLGSCLLDMVRVGMVSEEKVDSFNVPLFYPPIKNVKEIVESNGIFRIERMRPFHVKNNVTFPTVQRLVLFYRAVLDEMIDQHFGGGIGDELFNRLAKKVKEFPNYMNPKKQKIDFIFVLLKRKPNLM
ncbi:hypothetical protein RIF29_42333 [Crotalaria pallida]|uniref:Uncharacterized protein n=1 Tax=Crotalaria pallida TaxID=3830 RepID=A0AAN9ECA2_CROPI